MLCVDKSLGVKGIFAQRNHATKQLNQLFEERSTHLESQESESQGGTGPDLRQTVLLYSPFVRVDLLKTHSFYQLLSTYRKTWIYTRILKRNDITNFIETPPSRGWQLSEGLRLFYSFVYSEILTIRFGTSCEERLITME